MFIIGTGIFFYTALNFLYKGYGISMAPREAYTWRLIRPLGPLTYGTSLIKGPMADATIFFVLGMVLMFANSWLRQRYLWWPLEPVGFAWGTRYAFEEIGNFMVIGLLKTLIIRYGGTSLYNKLRP